MQSYQSMVLVQLTYTRMIKIFAALYDIIVLAIMQSLRRTYSWLRNKTNFLGEL